MQDQRISVGSKFREVGETVKISMTLSTYRRSRPASRCASGTPRGKGARKRRKGSTKERKDATRILEDHPRRKGKRKGATVKDTVP